MSVPFIQLNDSGKFEISPSAASLIQAIPGKILPVVVAGRYRGGKSTLLNFFVNELSKKSGAGKSPASFAVGSSIKSVTRGLHLWSSPILIGDCTVLLIDSEGLNSTNQNNAFDTQIFSLSVLLSSVFLLNSHSVIDESSIENLDLVVKMTEKIRVQQNNDKNDKKSSITQFAAHFPVFFWILRDFALDLEIDGRTMTPNEYLEGALQAVPVGNPPSRTLLEKNRIRETIRSVFPIRECFPLIRPTAEESQLKNVSALPMESLRPEFRNQIQTLINAIFTQGKPKQFFGQPVNGTGFLQLARSYVDSFNSGALPTIFSAWQSVVEIQMRQLADSLEKRVAAAFANENHLLSETEINAKYEKIRTEIAEAFQQHAVGDQNQKSAFYSQLGEKIRLIHDNFRQMQQFRAAEQAGKLLESLWAGISLEKRLEKGEFHSPAAIVKEIDRFCHEFLTKSSGLDRERHFREFFLKQLTAIIGFLYEKGSEMEKLAQAAKEREKEGNQKLRALEGENREIKKEAEMNNKFWKEEKTRLEGELKKLSALEVEIQRLRAENFSLEGKNQLENQKARAEIEKIQLALENERERRVRAESEEEKGKSREIHDKQQLEREIQQLKKRLEENQKLEARNSSLEQENRRLEGEYKKTREENGKVIEQLKKLLAAEKENQKKIAQAHEVEREQEAAKKRSRSSGAPASRPSGRLSEVFQANQSMDYEPGDAQEDFSEEDNAPESPPHKRPARESSSSAVSSSSRQSLRPEVDPNTLSINQLKSWLTELDIILGFGDQKKPKAFYVEMILDKVPGLREKFGQGEKAGKSAKKSAKK